MAEESDGSGVRSTVIGAVIAGGASIVVLVALTAAAVGSAGIRAVAAVALGVVIAQLYERRLA